MTPNCFIDTMTIIENLFSRLYHRSVARSRTKDDVCDDDKVAVMQAPTYENLTLKRVEINAAKTELEADFGMI